MRISRFSNRKVGAKDPLSAAADLFRGSLDAITEFDEKLWLTVIDTVTVHADGRMTFKFQGGKTLTSY